VEEVEELEEEDLEDEDLEEELDEEDYDDEDEDEEWEEEDVEDDPPPPKPKLKKVKPPVKKPAPAKKKPAPKPKVEEDEAEVIEVKKVDTVVAEEVLTGLLDAMDKNQSLVVTKLANNKWQFSSGTVAVAAGPKLKGQEYWDEVLTDEYKEWQADWSTLTYAEKKKKAKSMKVKWEEHEDERVDNIRISQAVQAKLGVEKYREDYRTRSARSRLKGN
jgi:hypothetical protein